MSGLQKNVASQKIRVFAWNSTTGAAVTGDAANLSCKVAKDWGSATALTDTSATETEDGYYLFDLSQAETNANVLDFYPQSSTPDVVLVATPATVYTVLAGHKLPSDGLDNVLVESGISASASLTDDAATQLTSINIRQAVSLMQSILAGVLSGAQTGSESVKQTGKPAGSTRATVTVDNSGNRSALTLKVPT